VKNRLLRLKNGEFTKVDPEDFDYISKFLWRKHKSGYAIRSVRIKGVLQDIFLHRIINKTPKGYFTDHINGNRLDNRKLNLRTATRQENNQNSKKSAKKHTSKYKGVHFRKDIDKWRSDITLNRKTIFIGHFGDERDAALAYDNAAKKYFGEFAKTNQMLYPGDFK